jgi:hypothetical protein
VRGIELVPDRACQRTAGTGRLGQHRDTAAIRDDGAQRRDQPAGVRTSVGAYIEEPRAGRAGDHAGDTGGRDAVEYRAQSRQPERDPDDRADSYVRTS